ncbi:uncharacterized protein [Branchiostoma lanceolatum]|uniref:uncharacterized protein n=1 Tax=Branchiostoma lanceolatum TaxID=7740 RepID=UPI003453F5A1
MKVASMIAVMVVAAVLVEMVASTGESRLRSLMRRRRRRRRPSISAKKEETAAGALGGLAEQLEMLQDAAAMLKEAVDEAEELEGASLDLGGPQEVKGLNDDLDGDAFGKKAANLQGPAGELEKKMNEVEEDAALGQVEEELEELEEELEGANGDPDVTD